MYRFVACRKFTVTKHVLDREKWLWWGHHPLNYATGSNPPETADFLGKFPEYYGTQTHM